MTVHVDPRLRIPEPEFEGFIRYEPVSDELLETQLRELEAQIAEEEGEPR